MDEHLQQDINELLEQLDAQENTSRSAHDENQQGTEVIDVFIVRRQVGEPELTTVESTLADTSDEQETQTAPTEQETTELPEFFTEQVRKDLGPFWDSLPAEALHHDPNAYLMSETVRPSLRAAAPG